MLRKRVEVLFDEEEYKRLEQIARANKQSVGSLVREAVEKYVVRPSEEERRKAFEWLTSQNFGPVGSPEEIKQFLDDTYTLDSLRTTNFPQDAELIRAIERRVEKYIEKYGKSEAN